MRNGTKWVARPHRKDDAVGRRQHGVVREAEMWDIAVTPRRRSTGRPRPDARRFPPRETYCKGRLRIDFDAYEVFVDGRKVSLFLREFKILRFLVRWPNRVFQREEILAAVWGEAAADIGLRTIDVHVRRLRQRIEQNDAHPELIVTVRGVGYMFDERALDSGPLTQPRTTPAARTASFHRPIAMADSLQNFEAQESLL